MNYWGIISNNDTKKLNMKILILTEENRKLKEHINKLLKIHENLIPNNDIIKELIEENNKLKKQNEKIKNKFKEFFNK